MLKFDNNNIITGEIKQLLKEFNLPQVKVWKAGMPVFDDCLYIYDNNLCIGNQSALIVIKPYIYGQAIQNVTKNLVLNSLLYDSYTHKYLGDYLRFHRDIKHVDLMSMYNCFSNELCKTLKIFKSGAYDFDTTNDTFKIYMVPVKWFQKYTIGIDCDTGIELIAGIYDDGKLISYSYDTSDFDLYDSTYFKTSGTRFSKPFTYDKIFNLTTELITKRLYLQEPNLKLFIKVPATSKSSVVVLEGDYAACGELIFDADSGFATRKPTTEVCNFEVGTVQKTGQPTFVYRGAQFERQYLSRPQLLDFNSTISYPFADRLIEYLFNNVITSDDEIAKNIERLQKRLVQRFNTYLKDSGGNYVLDENGNKIHVYVGMPSIISNPSVWTTQLRNVCYDVILRSNLSKNNAANKFDLIGFVDKDTEQIIGE